jgi:hypothetical protein
MTSKAREARAASSAPRQRRGVGALPATRRCRGVACVPCKQRAAAAPRQRRFLGVDDSRAPPPLSVTVKQSGLPLAKGVSNFAELEVAERHHLRLRGAFA